MRIRAEQIIVFIAALALPVFFIPGGELPVRLSKEIFALWAGAAIVICAVPNWWIRGFISLCLVHVIVNPAENSYWQMGLILAFAGFYIVIRNMDSREIRWLLWIVCAIAVVQAILVITQAYGMWDNRMHSWEHVRGFSGRANDVGGFFVLSLPAFWIVGSAFSVQRTGFFLRLAAAAGSILVLSALWLTRTTAPVVSLVAGVLFWAALARAPWKLKACIGAVVLGAAICFFVRFDDVRYTLKQHPVWKAWKIAQRQNALKPWGYGLGSFKDLFPFISGSALSELERLPDGQWVQKEAWQQLINEYLQTRFELGWPFYWIAGGFFAAFVFGLISAPPAGIRLAAASGIVMLAVGCFGFFWMHLADVAFPGVMWIAVWDRENERVRRKEG